MPPLGIGDHGKPQPLLICNRAAEM